MGEPMGGDALLLARLRSGDDGALAAIYDQHAAMVFGLARRVTRDEHLAGDITQDVFTYLWQQPDRVDLTRGSLRAYLAVVAHRRAVDEVRRVVRRGRAETRAAPRAQTIDEGHEAAVVDDAERSWRGTRVAAVLDGLPDDQRQALMLAYFEGHTYKEVARVLGIPEGTAKSRLRLALARLRVSLSDDLRAAT